MMNVDTGITSEVFTIKSEIKLIDIFNEIISKKSDAVFEYIESLNIDLNAKIVVIGTYFTGVGIVKKLSGKYENILLIDIYPHLEELLQTGLGGSLKNEIEFSSDLDLIYSGDVVIDTTGFGGISVEQSSKLDVDAFIIEDPVAEDNDKLLKDKNNIHERLDAVNSQNKAILKSKGINTKTSGTMTLTIGVLTNLLNRFLERPGVLYCACEMGFFEEVIFKQKDIAKFIELSDVNAFKVSTIKPFDLDELIREEIDRITSEMIL
ncbi:SAM-dependent methyltransferase HcgC family protein [Methanobrevibacter sp.]|uniref:SAM-dependent methyltransferase HcgC family protein n=1 Tax=Methanobrevibacter sp. TaxID=66852 RepID=UPI00388EFACA